MHTTVTCGGKNGYIKVYFANRQQLAGSFTRQGDSSKEDSMKPTQNDQVLWNLKKRALVQPQQASTCCAAWLS